MQGGNHNIQLERILFFSDAVIAIAITLLIIEIKAPHLPAGRAAADSFGDLVPKFAAFLVSFFVIAIYWKAHHHLFGFVHGYTDKLIWLNTFFLLSIVLMPFSSALYSENFGNNTAYGVYCGNIVLTGFLNCWLVNYIGSPKAGIASVGGNKSWRQYYLLRGLIPPFIFLVSLLLAIVSPLLSRLCFLLIFPLIIWVRKRYGKGIQ